MKIKKCLTLCVCAILSVGGLCLIFTWSLIFDALLSLERNPILANIFVDTLLKKEVNFYLFNWTNPEDFYNASTKPRFKQLGPYSFLQTERKTNVSWNKNGTVTFSQLKFYYYHQEKSKGDYYKDNITNVNPSVLGVAYMTRNWNYFVKRSIFLPLGLMYPTAHTTAPAHQLLFDGYPEPLFELANSMSFLDLRKEDRFGWAYKRNGTSDQDGVFNMGTGGDGTTLGETYNWNYKSQYDYYGGKCGKIGGSAGYFFPRNLKADTISVFSTYLKRPVTLKYVGDVVVNNIAGRKYVSGNYMLDNGTINPENNCYCTGECIPTGVANISSSRQNAPVFISLPHFSNADPYYLSMVEGLKPDEDKYEFSMTIEPTTGIVLEAKARIQINLLVLPISGTRLFENVSKAFFPMMWTEQKAQIPAEEAFLLKIILAVPAICVAVGVLFNLITVGLLFYIYRIWRRERQKYSDENMPLK